MLALVTLLAGCCGGAAPVPDNRLTVSDAPADSLVQQVTSGAPTRRPAAVACLVTVW